MCKIWVKWIFSRKKWWKHAILRFLLNIIENDDFNLQTKFRLHITSMSYAWWGHWPRKGVWECAALKTPFSRLFCSSLGSHFKQKGQFTRPPFEEIWKLLASTASYFAQILALKLPNLEIFSSQAPNWEVFSSQAPNFGNFQFTSPLLQRQISIRNSHTSGIRAARPYLKKLSASPWGYMAPKINTSPSHVPTFWILCNSL